VIINPAVSITTTSLANWTFNQGGYSQTISASGGTGTKTFAVTSGTLPNGLTLSSVGVLSGLPTAPGTFSFAITVTDAVGASKAQSYLLTINPALAFTTTTLAGWTVNRTGYAQTVSATGGTGSRSFAETGTLPPGMHFTTAGVLSGTPTTVGSYTFTGNVTDTVGASASNSFTAVINPVLVITTTSLPNWRYCQ